MTKNNVVSDKEEIAKANSILKKQSSEKTAGGSLGESASSCPIVPLGTAIFCKWNVKESNLLLNKEDQDKMMGMIEPFMTVIGVGGSIQSLKVGDKIYIKQGSEASIQSYELEDGFKFHLLFEHVILGVIK